MNKSFEIGSFFSQVLLARQLGPAADQSAVKQEDAGASF
jgi:hypothetical protein